MLKTSEKIQIVSKEIEDIKKNQIILEMKILLKEKFAGWTFSRIKMAKESHQTCR